MIPHGQSFGTFGEIAGLDPDCRDVAIATEYTLTEAVDSSGKVLDLSAIPVAQQDVYALRSPGGGSSGCNPCQVEIDVNGTSDKSDDLTLLNPPQPVSAVIKLLSGGPGIQVQLGVMPASRATLDTPTVTLSQGSMANVTITPRQVSASANDVTLVATVNGVVVGTASFTIVNVSLSSLGPSGNSTFPGRIRASDTPTMMTADRIPPRADTPVGISIQPNLTGSGQWVTLYEANASPQNGTFTIAGKAGLTPGAGLKVISSQTVNVRGASQTTPTGGNGGGNAGNLALGVAVRSQPVLQSAGFSVAAIPVGMIGRLIGNCTAALCRSGYDGIVVGYDVFPDSTTITDLDQVTILEQVQVVAATGSLTPLLSDVNTSVQPIPRPANGTFTDRHDVPTVDVTGTGTSLSAQVFIFNDLRTGVTNIPIQASGFNITRSISADNSGDLIVRTSVFGQAATAKGYTTSAGQTTSPVLSGTQP